MSYSDLLALVGGDMLWLLYSLVSAVLAALCVVRRHALSNATEAVMAAFCFITLTGLLNILAVGVLPGLLISLLYLGISGYVVHLTRWPEWLAEHCVKE